MIHAKVFGSGCMKCRQTGEMLKTGADKIGKDIEIEKITDYAEIAKAGVMATPGVMIEGKLVHAGGLPTEENVLSWLKDA